VIKKKETKDKGKAIDNDESDEDEASADTEVEQHVPAHSRRSESVRQALFQQDHKYFLKIQAKKAKQDRKAAAAADELSDAEDELPAFTAATAKPPVPQKGRAPKKPAAPRKTATAKPTIQNGSIAKGTKAQPAGKKARRHREADYQFEPVPDLSDDEPPNKHNTIAKLRETIDRHADWCPFVLLNKKLHSVHRRVRALEYAASEGGDGGEPEVPEVDSEAHNGHGNVEGMDPAGSGDDDDNNGEDVVEDNSEDDNNSGKQLPKPQKATQSTPKFTAINAATGPKTARKTGSAKPQPQKQAATKTAGTVKAPANTTNPIQIDSGSDKEESQSGSEDEQGAVETDSGEEIGLLDDAAVEQGRKAHEKEKLMTPAAHKAAKATNPLPTKGTSGSKRKATDLESDPQHGAKKLDSKKLKAGETALMDLTVPAGG
jgi:hypothetical protein